MVSSMMAGPNNRKAEVAVVGSLLIDGERIKDVRDVVSPEAFCDEQCQTVYRACLELNKQDSPIDQITVAQHLHADPQMLGFMSGVMAEVPTSYYANHYAKIVAELSFRRQMIKTAGTLGEMAKSDSTPDELIGAMQNEVKTLGHTVTPLEDIVSPRIMAEEIMTLIASDQEKSLSYGYLDLDEATTGMYPEEYIVIGGRPGMAKTQLMLEMSNHLSVAQGKIGLFLSLEMSKRSMAERFIAMTYGITVRDIRKRLIGVDKWGDIAELSGKVSETPLYFLTSNVSSDEVCTHAVKMKERIGLDYLMVDYIQLFKDCRGVKNTHQALSSASRAMKMLAKELKIPVIVASQVNRGVEARENQRPRLSDLKESGSLEEDSDTVLLLYRDEQVNPQSTERGILEIKMAKNRQLGTSPKVELTWQKNRYRNASYT